MAGIERRHWIRALASIALVSGAWASEGFGPKWTYSSGSQNWLPRNVALGDSGGQVLTQIGSGYNSTRLLSAHDWNPPTPVWERNEGQATYFQRTASSDARDVHATLHDVASAVAGERNVVLRRYRSTSNQPLWSFTFPIRTTGHEWFDVAASRDGRRIVAILYNVWDSKTDLACFDSDSATPRFYGSVQTFGFPRHMRVSADGGKVYLASDARITVVDTQTGAIEEARTVFDTLSAAHALSGDARFYAYGTSGAAKLFRRGSSGFQQALVQSLGSSWLCRGVDLSGDGGVLVTTYVELPALQRVRIDTLDVPASLAQGAPVVLASHLLTGNGNYTNDVSRLELSADGRRLAVGLWGDGPGGAPEVLVFDTTSSTPIASYGLPGSVFDLDLSADGNTLAVSSKAVHFSAPGSGGRIDLFDLAQGDLVLRGQPRAGQAVRVELSGTPGSEARLLWSDRPAGRGVELAGIGQLHLDRTSVAQVSLGLIDGAGRASGDFVIPATLPVGGKLYLQGLVTEPRALTETWLEVTVLP